VASTKLREETPVKREYGGMYLVRSVNLKMQLWIDCGCADHVMDLKTART